MFSPISPATPSPTMSDYDMQYAASHNGLWLSDNDHELFNLYDSPNAGFAYGPSYVVTNPQPTLSFEEFVELAKKNDEELPIDRASLSSDYIAQFDHGYQKYTIRPRQSYEADSRSYSEIVLDKSKFKEKNYLIKNNI
jgi:hypothetical protein